MEGCLQSIWQPYCPDSLADVVISYLVRNPDTICVYDPYKREYNLKEGVTLSTASCERLLQQGLNEINCAINDCFLGMYKDPEHTSLRRVDIHGSSQVTDKGVEVILRHPIIELNISGCPKLTGKTLHLINASKDSIYSLIIGNSAQIFQETIMNDDEADEKPQKNDYEQNNALPIIMQSNLRKLVINELVMPGDPNYCQRLISPLDKLHMLDLSSCRQLGDMNYLVTLRRLMSLTLYDVPNLQEAVSTICELKSLRHLDISQSTIKTSYANPDHVLHKIIESLPLLASLDISGTNLGGSEGWPNIDDPRQEVSDIPGLRSRVNHPLDFLGLFETLRQACHRKHIPARKIAGSANEKQLLISANAFCDKPKLLERVLCELDHIYDEYEMWESPKEILDVTVRSMKRHPKESSVQFYGSCLIFHLCSYSSKCIARNDNKLLMNIGIKRKLVRLLLDAMDRHHNDNEMMVIGLLPFLSSFYIPDDVIFEYERLVSTLLCSLSRENQYEVVQWSSMFILNKLAAKVSNQHKRLFGEKGAIEILIRMIRGKLSVYICDRIMNQAWEILSKMTEEVPLNCQKFVEGSGMELLFDCLRTFSQRKFLIRYMTLVVRHISMVKELKRVILTDKFAIILGELLDRTLHCCEVNYNAAAILSYILSDPDDLWPQRVQAISKEDILSTMGVVMSRWDLKIRRREYRVSLPSVLEILRNGESVPSEVHYWAIWTLANLVTTYFEEYCPRLVDEGGTVILEELINKPGPFCKKKQLAAVILAQCANYQNNYQILDYCNEGGSTEVSDDGEESVEILLIYQNESSDDD